MDRRSREPSGGRCFHRGRSGGGDRRGECAIAAGSAARRRTCIGCRRARPVDALVRIAFAGDRLRPGRTLPGRGAWICASEPACLQRAATPGRLRRAFRRELPAGAAEDLIVALQPHRSAAEPSAAGTRL
ncbi:MAG: YlxR family protein [Acidimicrobiia bacterium]|nr:YlxR family protein [Acidimicrobiia bacterium]